MIRKPHAITVSELIASLNTFPQSAKVILQGDEEGNSLANLYEIQQDGKHIYLIPGQPFVEE